MTVSFEENGKSASTTGLPSSRMINGSRLKTGCSDFPPAEFTVLKATLVDALMILQASGPELSSLVNLHCRKSGSADSIRYLCGSSRESSPACKPSAHCVSSSNDSWAFVRQSSERSVKSYIKAASNTRLSSMTSSLHYQVKGTDCSSRLSRCAAPWNSARLALAWKRRISKSFSLRDRDSKYIASMPSPVSTLSLLPNRHNWDVWRMLVRSESRRTLTAISRTAALLGATTCISWSGFAKVIASMRLERVWVFPVPGGPKSNIGWRTGLCRGCKAAMIASF